MTSKQVCDTQEAECWENNVPWRKERHQQTMNFHSFIYQELSRFKMWDLQSYPEDLTCRVRAVCFPAVAQAFNHIPTSSQNCPWGNRLQECVQTAGCHTVVTQVRWHSIAKRPSTALVSRLLASEIPKVGQKQSLSEIKKKKKQLYGFSSSCKFGYQGPVSTVRLRRCLCCIYPYFTKT